MDEGHSLTDKELTRLIQKLDGVYGQASKEVEEKLNDYMRRFKVKDAIKQRQVKTGEISREEWVNWRVGQIAVGQRWEEMRNTLAEDLTNVDKIAAQMVGESMHDVYALNHNFGTFEVEKGSLIDTSYTLYDRQTVERLVKDNPTLLKAPSLNINKDYRWNAQNFQSAITQSILQGEDIRKTAKRVALGTTKKDRNAAVRNARTATTNAENAGRCDSYKRAEKMGIKLKQVWLATLDGRTRDSHRGLDGEKISVGGKFSNGLRFPGDPQGVAHEVWNCRCTLIAEVDGVDYNLADDTQRNSKLGDMTYEEWKNKHIKLYSEEDYRKTIKKWVEQMDSITPLDADILESFINSQVKSNGSVSYVYGLSRGIAMSNAELNALQVGSVFSEDKLSSWSNRSGIAQSFARNNVTEAKPNMVVIRTKDPMYYGAKLKNALTLSKYDEGEVLVSAKAKFEIIKKKKNGNYIEIWVHPVR